MKTPILPADIPTLSRSVRNNLLLQHNKMADTDFPPLQATRTKAELARMKQPSAPTPKQTQTNNIYGGRGIMSVLFPPDHIYPGRSLDVSPKHTQEHKQDDAERIRLQDEKDSEECQLFFQRMKKYSAYLEKTGTVLLREETPPNLGEDIMDSAWVPMKERTMPEEEYKTQLQLATKRLHLNTIFTATFQACKHSLHPKKHTHLEKRCQDYCKIRGITRIAHGVVVPLEGGCPVCGRMLKTPHSELYFFSRETLNSKAVKLCENLTGDWLHNRCYKEFLKDWETAHLFLDELRILPFDLFTDLVESKKSQGQILEELKTRESKKSKYVIQPQDFYWP